MVSVGNELTMSKGVPPRPLTWGKGGELERINKD